MEGAFLTSIYVIATAMAAGTVAISLFSALVALVDVRQLLRLDKNIRAFALGPGQAGRRIMHESVGAAAWSLSIAIGAAVILYWLVTSWPN